MTITNQGSRRQSKQGGKPPVNRLPSTRERRPAMAALAVLLIAGGAVLAGWLALRESHTSSYLMADQAVHKGEKIELADLATIELPTGNGNFIPTSDAHLIVDSYAETDWVAGQPLVVGMAGDAPAVGADEARVGLDLEPGQFPPGLVVGDDVDMAYVEGDYTATAEVVAVKTQSSGDGLSVTVLMSNACSEDFSRNAADGNVTVQVRAATDKAPACE